MSMPTHSAAPPMFAGRAAFAAALAGLPVPDGAALEAALHPAPGDALYFVALGDGSGRHVFSATLDQHNAAVRQYLDRLRRPPLPEDAAAAPGEAQAAPAQDAKARQP